MVSRPQTSDRGETGQHACMLDRQSISAALEAVSELIGQPVNLQEKLEASLDQVIRAAEASMAQVLLVDEESGGSRVVAQRGVLETLDRQSEINLGVALAAEVVDAGQVLLVGDLSRDPRLSGPIPRDSGLRAYLGVPLRIEGKTVGAINVLATSPLHFDAMDAALLSGIGGLVAMAVQNNSLREELGRSQLRVRERVKEIGALYDITKEALTASDIGSFLDFVARRLPASMRHAQAYAVIQCSVGAKGYLAWSESLDRAEAERLCIAPGDGITGGRVAQGETVIQPTIGGDEDVGAGVTVGSLIAVPIAMNNEVVGSICIYYPDSKWRFLEEEKQLLFGISEQIAQFAARDSVERDSRQRTQEIFSLYQVSKALAAVVELEDLLPVIEDTLVETLRPAEAGALLLFDEGTGMLTVESAFGYDINPLRRISLQVGESISGKVFQSGRPEVWATPEEAAQGMINMSDDNRAFFRQASGGLDYPNSAIGVPLVYREGKIGVVTLETLRSRTGLSKQDLPFLQALAELIVVNVDKIWLLKQAEQTKAMEEANRLRSELVAALAHDMRTPLASIKGYASAMLLDDVEWDAETMSEHLRIIDEEANELQTMIQDLLESSIIDAGLLQIEKEPILIPRLVEQIVGEMTRRTAKHRFVTSFGRDFPIVNADPGRITQVLRNVLDNAVKYSPDGGLVVVRGQVAEDEVILSVADEGIGLSPEHLNRLFEKFFRLKPPPGQQVRGSGLGLPVSRTIVESHGGRIWADSELGKGTTIYFSLPKDEVGDSLEES